MPCYRYAHGLTLQELATKMDTTRSNQLALLSQVPGPLTFLLLSSTQRVLNAGCMQASERYEAATRLRPTSHAALYK